MTQEANNIIRFQTTDPDHFTDRIAPVAQAVTMQQHGKSPFSAEVRLARLPRLGLFTVRVSSARVLGPGARGYCGITIPLDNSIEVVTRGQVETFAPGSAHFLNADDAFDLRSGDNANMLVANIDMSILHEYARKLHGGEVPKALRFGSRLSLDKPGGLSFWHYVNFVWGDLSRGGAVCASPLVLKEMEDALVATLLYATMEEPSHDARGGRSDTDPAYLRRAEDYILAHLTDPMSLADLAEGAGVSARALSKAFSQRYGTGPMGFLKARRLEAAQRELLAADPNRTTVTDIALRFGFIHFGQFSADYRKAFQELPSKTLRR